MQFLQVLALKLGAALLVQLAGLTRDSAALALLLGVAVLVLTLRLPALVGQYGGDGLGFVRYLAYRQAAQALTGGAGARPRRGQRRRRRPRGGGVRGGGGGRSGGPRTGPAVSP